MTAKLAVTVAVDMDATAVTLKPVGVLTRDNVRGLIAVAHRAQRVLADFTVQADLDRVQAVAPEALRGLADAGVKTLVPHYGDFPRKSLRPRPAAPYSIHGKWRQEGAAGNLLELGPSLQPPGHPTGPDDAKNRFTLIHDALPRRRRSVEWNHVSGAA